MKKRLFHKEESRGTGYLCLYASNGKRVGSRYVGTDKKGKIIGSFQGPQLDGSGWKPFAEKKVPDNVMLIFESDIKEMEIVQTKFRKRGSKSQLPPLKLKL